MYSAVKATGGLCVLPCYLGDNDETLFRIGTEIPELATDLWLLTHADLRQTARVRAVLDFAATALKKRQPFVPSERPANPLSSV